MQVIRDLFCKAVKSNVTSAHGPALYLYSALLVQCHQSVKVVVATPPFWRRREQRAAFMIYLYGWPVFVVPLHWAVRAETAECVMDDEE